MTTPAHQLPTIKEGTTLGVRFSVGTWCAIVGFIGSSLAIVVGFAIWLHTIYADQQEMKEAQSKQAEVLKRIEDAVREIEFRQKYGVFSSLPRPTTANP
jgi:hypothetical protein